MSRSSVFSSLASQDVSKTEFDKLDGVTATTAELNVLAGGITSLGTVTSGTISTGVVIDDPTMTQGSDATGDVYYRAANGRLTRLAAGAADTVLTSGGAGVVPSFAAAGGGLFASIAIIYDQKAYNVAGGTFTSGSWQTREFNQEIDADGIVAIASNQFTLAAGTYTIEWSMPAVFVDGFGSRLYNDTDSSVVIYGSSENSANNFAAYYNTRSVGFTSITISGTKAFEIQGKCEATYAADGLGVQVGFYGSGYAIYTIVKILKHS